ncbi:MAG: hypothetical protein ACE5IK_15010, partial [Acidobacteriota bacterium]
MITVPENPEDRWFGTHDDMNDVIPISTVPGNPTKVFKPTPDSGGAIYPMWPCTIMMTVPSRQILGEIQKATNSAVIAT